MHIKSYIKLYQHSNTLNSIYRANQNINYIKLYSNLTLTNKINPKSFCKLNYINNNNKMKH